ncbi:high-affinity branched-chain amino acid ABC transporter permease LivM [Iodidimonas sp. SYSU 1G8]|uniref:high-affinity branched-chain amino acid ABC transporter permease LivM n=1 Tax=Iodidimonas sp. SYSU 1G8 TaxID=3133967 RepID=UPI0031FEC58B
MAGAPDRRIPPLASMLRDAGLAAFVAALLAIPLLGFRLVDSAQGLSLDYRFLWVLYAAAAVFLGRLLLTVTVRLLAPATARWARSLAREEEAAGPPINYRLIFGWVLIGAALVLPLMPFADRSVVSVATLVLIYVMLGWGLNIVVGLAGLLDLGYVAFYAIGAYSSALLSLHFGLSFWICLPLAGIMGAFLGILLGFPVLRLRGDYLAIVTLGFGEIIRVILLNWQEVTNGPNGITGIPRPTLFGLSFDNPARAPAGSTGFADFFGLSYSAMHWMTFLYYLILVLALVTTLFAQRIRRLPTGRAWEALREDEIACRSLGINPVTVKLSAFAIGASFAGLAGAFFSIRQGFISPESFSFIESATILAIVVLGGMGSQIGIVLAAVLLVGLPEWFRELQEYRMVAFGGAMVLIMLWRPQGLLSHRSPTVTLDDGKDAPEDEDKAEATVAR